MGKLTDIAIRNLRPRAQRYEKPAGNGLYVIVQPTGAKSYALRYRFAGKPRKLTFDGGLTLAAARKVAAEAVYELERGIDPAAVKREAKRAQRLAGADTFEAVCTEYFERAGKNLRSAHWQQNILTRLVFPTLRDRQISQIRRSEVIRLLDRIEDTNGKIIADRALAIVRRIMNWYAGRSEDFVTPIVRGMARTKPGENARERTLSDDEIRAVWRTAEVRGDQFSRLVQLLLLTAARRTEAANMTWQELDGADWLLPASRNKVKQELVRPLSQAAQDTLAKTPKIAGSPYVFTADGIHGLGGLGRRKKLFDIACGVTDWTLHDLRRTARSLMSRAGVPSDHAERCLGHVIGGVREVYDRHAYHREKQLAFEALAAQIERIVNPQPNVLSMRG